MKCRVQKAERPGSEERKSSAEETQERIGLRLLKRTESAADKCPTPAEERFRVKLFELFSLVTVNLLVKQVNYKVGGLILELHVEASLS